ncbi:hypothetical protein EVAR_81546_1 [Eumeta japonica]|uniref:Uncharacterized protein n=1 Tax=Eumeta variegata TaxID=151549 RepID=A0A4C1UZV9_EUMVA|nr:hypothetical protein EVAR_81546_1 [Eumeta japonica]
MGSGVNTPRRDWCLSSRRDDGISCITCTRLPDPLKESTKNRRTIKRTSRRKIFSGPSREGGFIDGVRVDGGSLEILILLETVGRRPERDRGCRPLGLARAGTESTQRRLHSQDFNHSSRQVAATPIRLTDDSFARALRSAAGSSLNAEKQSAALEPLARGRDDKQRHTNTRKGNSFFPETPRALRPGCGARPQLIWLSFLRV